MDDGSGSRESAASAAELVARTSYGRLIAILASRTRDIAGSEDALAEAFASALSVWPTRGVPSNPEAWLLTTARRNLMHGVRHRGVQREAVDQLIMRIDERTGVADLASLDERLRLLFVCAHPAIDESVRTPLLLQTVLGLDAQRIASAFLVAPKTMGQRLVRAKTKIRDAGLRFEVPDLQELPSRLDDVLRAVYAAFGVGWDDLDHGQGLHEEALYLGRTLVSLMPEEPEAKGLLAVMLHCDARRAARRSSDGTFVPLREQDPRRWSRPQIEEAEALLVDASRSARFGRYQCEAAIQSVHAQRAITGTTNHDALRVLYDLLLSRAPSLGAAVARASVLIDVGDLDAATRALDQLVLADVDGYQPFWVVRARIATHRGDANAARLALQRALGLTTDHAVRCYLEAQLG